MKKRWSCNCTYRKYSVWHDTEFKYRKHSPLSLPDSRGSEGHGRETFRGGSEASGQVWPTARRDQPDTPEPSLHSGVGASVGSFLCLRNHVREETTMTKRLMSFFHPKIHIQPIKFLLFLHFLAPFYAALCLICLLQVPLSCACPLSQKTSFYSLFFVIPRGKVGLNFFLFLNFWLAGCVFNKWACQPYLPASLLVPFWRSRSTATRSLARLSQSLYITIAFPFFIFVSSLTSRDAFFLFLFWRWLPVAPLTL